LRLAEVSERAGHLADRSAAVIACQAGIECHGVEWNRLIWVTSRVECTPALEQSDRVLTP